MGQIIKYIRQNEFDQNVTQCDYTRHVNMCTAQNKKSRDDTPHWSDF